MQVRVPKQRLRPHGANFPPPAVDIAGVVDNPIRTMRLEVRPSDKDHGVEGFLLHSLVEKQQIAGVSRAEVARNQVRIVSEEGGAIGEFHERALPKIVRTQRTRLRPEEFLPERTERVMKPGNITEPGIIGKPGMLLPLGGMGFECIPECEANQGCAIPNLPLGPRRGRIILRLRQERKPAHKILAVPCAFKSSAVGKSVAQAVAPRDNSRNSTCRGRTLRANGRTGKSLSDTKRHDPQQHGTTSIDGQSQWAA